MTESRNESGPQSDSTADNAGRWRCWVKKWAPLLLFTLLRHRRDLAEVTGLSLFAVGLWRMSPNWCLVIVGGLIIAVSVLGTLRSDRIRHSQAERERKG